MIYRTISTDVKFNMADHKIEIVTLSLYMKFNRTISKVIFHVLFCSTKEHLQRHRATAFVLHEIRFVAWFKQLGGKQFLSTVWFFCEAEREIN